MGHLLLGIDVETTGLDVNQDRVTEIGAVLWDSQNRSPLIMYSTLVFETNFPVLTPEITKLTGIRPEDLTRFGQAPIVAMKPLVYMLEQADFIVAHNGKNFDFPIVTSEWARLGPVPEVWSSKPRIDSTVDVPYPDTITTRKLTHLAAEHGFVNPMAHRAVFDVMTMLKILDQYPLEVVIELSRSKDLLVRAVVTYEDREKAKGRGYRWNAEKKIWVKNIKECFLDKEVSEAGFKVTVLEGA